MFTEIRIRSTLLVLLVAMFALSVMFMVMAYQANRIIFWMVLIVVGGAELVTSKLK